MLQKDDFMIAVPKTEAFDILINRRSGTVLRLGEQQVSEDLRKAFAGRMGAVSFIEGGDIAEKVRQWAARYAGSGRRLVIGGGDGSVLTAAVEVMGRTDVTLGVLPLGTHNLFARQLGFSADFRQAAAQHCNSRIDDIDVGVVNGNPFLTGLLVDDNSVNFFFMREYIRERKFFPAIKMACAAVAGLLFLPKQELRVSMSKDGGEINLQGRFFMGSNNPLAPRSSRGIIPYGPANIKDIIGNMAAKKSLSGGEVVFYSCPGGFANVSRLLPHFYKGTWTSHPTVQTVRGIEFTISLGGGERKTIVLDGEIREALFPLKVKIIPKGLRICRPM